MLADGAGTELVLDVFRLNGLLLAAGDHLTAGEGLTAARWQVLGSNRAPDGADPPERAGLGEPTR